MICLLPAARCALEGHPAVDQVGNLVGPLEAGVVLVDDQGNPAVFAKGVVEILYEPTSSVDSSRGELLLALQRDGSLGQRKYGGVLPGDGARERCQKQPAAGQALGRDRTDATVDFVAPAGPGGRGGCPDGHQGGVLCIFPL